MASRRSWVRIPSAPPTLFLKKRRVVGPYPLLNVLLQCFRNSDHFFYFTMGDPATYVVVAYISLLAERIERSNELRVLSYSEL